MIKKLMLAVATLCLTMGVAFAQVDVNKADAAALDSVKGVGPAMSKAILDERAKGEFKDWADFQKRVKGVGDKKAMKLSEAGLQVNGKPMEASRCRQAGQGRRQACKQGCCRASKDVSTPPSRGIARNPAGTLPRGFFCLYGQPDRRRAMRRYSASSGQLFIRKRTSSWHTFLPLPA